VGIRLRFGAGPLRVSIPLTSRRRRRRRTRSYRRAKTYHGTATLADGTRYKCHHNHRTPQAANECAQKHVRSQQARKAVPPATPKPRANRVDAWRQRSRPPAAPNPTAYMQEGMALLQGLAAVNSPESARALVYHANIRIRAMTGNNPSHIAEFFNTFKHAAVNQGRAEVAECERAAGRAASQAQVDAATARVALVRIRNQAVEHLAAELGLSLT
jgi:hypothetical protein